MQANEPRSERTSEWPSTRFHHLCYLKRGDDEFVVFAVDVEHDFYELSGNVFRLEDGLEILLADVFDMVFHFGDQCVKT